MILRGHLDIGICNRIFWCSAIILEPQSDGESAEDEEEDDIQNGSFNEEDSYEDMDETNDEEEEDDDEEEDYDEDMIPPDDFNDENQDWLMPKGKLSLGKERLSLSWSWFHSHCSSLWLVVHWVGTISSIRNDLLVKFLKLLKLSSCVIENLYLVWEHSAARQLVSDRPQSLT